VEAVRASGDTPAETLIIAAMRFASNLEENDGVDQFQPVGW